MSAISYQKILNFSNLDAFSASFQEAKQKYTAGHPDFPPYLAIFFQSSPEDYINPNKNVSLKELHAGNTRYAKMDETSKAFLILCEVEKISQAVLKGSCGTVGPISFAYQSQIHDTYFYSFKYTALIEQLVVPCAYGKRA